MGVDELEFREQKKKETDGLIIFRRLCGNNILFSRKDKKKEERIVFNHIFRVFKNWPMNNRSFRPRARLRLHPSTVLFFTRIQMYGSFVNVRYFID